MSRRSEFEGPRTEGRERRRIPLRWMFGVALTGLSGLALIGSALYLGLDRQSNFAEAPEFAAPAAKEAAEGESVSPGKAIVWSARSTSSPPSIRSRSPMTIKVGDKEVLKAAALHAALDDADDDADRIRRRRSAVRSAQGRSTPRRKRATSPLEPGPAPDDSEVAFSSRDITAADAAAVKGELTLARGAGASRRMDQGASGRGRAPPADLPPQMMLMRTSRASVDPLGALSYATTGNVDFERAVHFDRSAHGAGKRHQHRQDAAEPARRRSRSSSCKFVTARLSRTSCGRNGADKDAIAAILEAFALKHGESPVAEGQKIILQFDGAADSDQAGADRPNFRLFRRATQGGRRDRRLRTPMSACRCVGAMARPNERRGKPTKAA